MFCATMVKISIEVNGGIHTFHLHTSTLLVAIAYMTLGVDPGFTVG